LVQYGTKQGLKLDLDTPIDIAAVDPDGREDVIRQIAEIIDVV
jgi:hypothetical protein